MTGQGNTAAGASGNIPADIYPSGQQFEGFAVGKTEKGSFVIKGEHFEQYREDVGNFENSVYESLRGTVSVEAVHPSQIEGIEIGDEYTGMPDPETFWGHHKRDKESYMELASHIPEVQTALANGRRLEDLKKDPVLKSCADLYFDPEHMPRVEKNNGYYRFDSDGRHRIIAARELGYRIPVRIVGIRRF